MASQTIALTTKIELNDKKGASHYDQRFRFRGACMQLVYKYTLKMASGVNLLFISGKATLNSSGAAIESKTVFQLLLF